MASIRGGTRGGWGQAEGGVRKREKEGGKDQGKGFGSGKGGGQRLRGLEKEGTWVCRTAKGGREEGGLETRP